MVKRIKCNTKYMINVLETLVMWLNWSLRFHCPWLHALNRPFSLKACKVPVVSEVLTKQMYRLASRCTCGLYLCKLIECVRSVPSYMISMARVSCLVQKLLTVCSVIG